MWLNRSLSARPRESGDPDGILGMCRYSRDLDSRLCACEEIPCERWTSGPLARRTPSPLVGEQQKLRGEGWRGGFKRDSNMTDPPPCPSPTRGAGTQRHRIASV